MNKKSKIWSYPKDKLQEVVNDCQSLIEIIKKLELEHIDYKALKNALLKLNINFSHIPLGLGANKNKKFSSKEKFSIENIFIENSTYFRGGVKKRLLENKLLEYRCAECGLSDNWNNKKLVLQLDHINGVPNDHRIENLRFLCPNCHSQTENFAGRASRKETFGKPLHKLKDKKCPNCNALICDVAERCGNCRIRTKINWPSIIEIENMLKEMPMTAVAKKLGVSDNAVKKHIRSKKKT